jgi:hypothetical protein
MSDSPIKARFDFIKSPLFRVIHADGVYGGVNPRGDLFINFFNERFPIPTTIVHELKASGELGEEVRSERETRNAIVREVEVGVHVELGVAKQMVEWLQQKIEIIEKAQQQIQVESLKEKT